MLLFLFLRSDELLLENSESLFTSNHQDTDTEQQGRKLLILIELTTLACWDEKVEM